MDSKRKVIVPSEECREMVSFPCIEKYSLLHTCFFQHSLQKRARSTTVFLKKDIDYSFEGGLKKDVEVRDGQQHGPFSVPIDVSLLLLYIIKKKEDMKSIKYFLLN